MLSADDIRQRLARLVLGLVLCGVGIAFLVRAGLGLDPWDVLHEGLAERTGLPIGTVTILAGFSALALWWPLRERPGIGTVMNAVLTGTVMNVLLPHLDEPEPVVQQVGFLVLGIGLMGLGSGFYIGAGLGPGPRDGLMTGLARRGHSLALMRTGIELAAVGVGWALGGTVGIGTVAFALAIGPCVHFFLDRLGLPRPGQGSAPGPALGTEPPLDAEPVPGPAV
jgi:uncharacterized membrane protein YczE